MSDVLKELEVLCDIARELEKLEAPARRRVLAWAYARFVTDRDTVECRMAEDE